MSGATPRHKKRDEGVTRTRKGWTQKGTRTARPAQTSNPQNQTLTLQPIPPTSTHPRVPSKHPPQLHPHLPTTTRT